MPKPTKPKKYNWKRLPDPISEDEINIQISWIANERTRQTLERQAKKIGCDSVHDYIWFAVVDHLVMDEQDSVLTDDGRIVAGWETMGEDGFPKNI
jgi:hypothetical protein